MEIKPEEKKEVAKPFKVPEGFDWKQLYKDAGMKKYLRKLSVAAQKAGLPNPNEFVGQIDAKNGSAIFFHAPTVRAIQAEMQKQQPSPPKEATKPPS